ncbi:hypothetical protein D3C75_1303170 [compost metagenome]
MPGTVLLHLSLPISDDCPDQHVEVSQTVVIAGVILQLREAAFQRGQKIKSIG